MSTTPPPLLLLLGGSFNPPHIGHLRIAIEAMETLRPLKTLFIPAPVPPHKLDARLLPFAMRTNMLRAAICSLPEQWGLEVCEVENERSGPSYTIDTLTVLAGRYPESRLVFVMGAEDYDQLATWLRWSDIPRFADIAVFPRKRYGQDRFERQTLTLWPEAKPLADSAPGVSLAFVLPEGGRCLYIPQPLLEISSSLIRDRFLAGRTLDFLVPPGVLDIMRQHDAAITQIWNR